MPGRTVCLFLKPLCRDAIHQHLETETKTLKRNISLKKIKKGGGVGRCKRNSFVVAKNQLSLEMLSES